MSTPQTVLKEFKSMASDVWKIELNENTNWGVMTSTNYMRVTRPDEKDWWFEFRVRDKEHRQRLAQEKYKELKLEYRRWVAGGRQI